MTKTVDATIKAALQFAALGIECFPIRGKNRPPKAWDKLATADEEAVLKLWEKHPWANVAAKCGQASRLIDINVNGAGGVDLLRELFGGELPVTWGYRSTRGPHWWFLWRAGFPDKARYFLGPGNEVEVIPGNGNAYTLAPPSVADGVKREWLPGCSPGECDLAEIGDEALARLTGARPGKTVAAGNGRPEPGGVFAEGRRNVELARIAGSYRRVGLGSVEIFAALAVVNRNRCEPPLAESEVSKIANSIARYEPEEDEGVEPKLEEWRLEIVDSDPKLYRVYSPLWPGAVNLKPTEYRRAWAVADAVIEQKDILLKPKFAKRWPKFAASAIQTAKHVEAKPDEIRSAVVAAAVLEYLSRARIMKEDQDIDPRGIACRMPNGDYVFRFAPMFEELRRSADRVKRTELSRLLDRTGAKKHQPKIGAKQVKLRRADQAALERLKAESEAKIRNPLI